MPRYSRLPKKPAERLPLEILKEHAAARLATQTTHLPKPHRPHQLDQLLVPGPHQVPDAADGVARINLVQGLGPALQLAEGYVVELPPEVHDALDARTNPTWPTTWFVPRTSKSGVFRDPYSVMNAWGANHGAFSYGHIGADLITLASMLRIPVYMHNVPEEQIFRPSAWNAFGTADLEGADFRACQNYGPLYR